MGVERRDVEVDEAHIVGGEDRPRAGGEVAVAGADSDDQIGLRGQRVGGGGAGGADRTHRPRVVVGKSTLAGLRLGDRYAGRFGKDPECVVGAAVGDPTARDDQRPVGRGNCRHGTVERRWLRNGSRHVPHAMREELLGPIVCFGLDVLGQRESDRAGERGVSEHTHGMQQRRGKLLGSMHPVEVGRDRAERVIDRNVPIRRVLQLLENGVGDPRGEDVAGQQQHRESVDRGQCRSADHVRGPGTHGRSHGHRAEPVALPSVARGRVHHGLLIATLEIAKMRRVTGDLALQQCLSDAGNIAVPEDAPASCEKGILDAVSLDALSLEESDEGLSDGESYGHRVPPAVTVLANGRRGSTA